MVDVIAPASLKELIHGEAEIAILDVRERGLFGGGHLFYASHCPYSRLELLAPRLVPNRAIPCVLCDGSDGLAERAARRLAALGYGRPLVLEGGVAGWAAAGFTLFRGLNVPSKTFGELLELACHTPMLTAEDVHRWQREGRPHLLFDTRPFAEYRRFTLPGARCVPNGELLYRLEGAVTDPNVPIVVTCAGRTRGLIGAQSLINAGVPNPVYAVENGTQGWLLAGYELERGSAGAPLPDMDPGAVQRGRDRAAALAEWLGVPVVGPDQLTRWAAEPDRSLHVLDVRTLSEFEAGHLPGARHAPAVQLVQALDEWTAVRRARLALIDDNGLRAVQAASWLRQMGREAVAVAGALEAGPLERGLDSPALDDSVPHLAVPCTPAELAAGAAAGHAVLDLRPSEAYRQERLPGARWVTRAQLTAAPSGPVFLVADEPAVADLAALDLSEVSSAPIRLLEGGLDAWRADGRALDTAPGGPGEAETIDVFSFASGRSGGNLDACRQYLSWETGLTAQIDPRERAELAPLVLHEPPPDPAPQS